jgi:hypothetical protein
VEETKRDVYNKVSSIEHIVESKLNIGCVEIDYFDTFRGWQATDRDGEV